MDGEEFNQIQARLENMYYLNKDLMEKIKEYISLFLDLIEINLYENEGSNCLAILKAKKYGSKTSLQEKIQKHLFILNKNIRYFQDELNKSKEEIMSGRLECGLCEGCGYREDLEWIRDDEDVSFHTVKKTCERCKGQGYLIINERYKRLIEPQFKTLENQLDFFKMLIENTKTSSWGHVNVGVL